ncbi:LysR family transcriptional regulator [Roseibium hamelinense]|nr:LysR substrate-binding domain-containing protein [Roseibium hamelinense]MTI42974.1 LysR family transcriptional regulator [Roseibium hamelinense]
MMQKMDIDELQALCMIAELGGVTRAAERLGLSQSAVSHKIRRLEDRLGRSLLRRQPGSPLLTEDGTKLLGYAKRILALHDEAVSTLSSRPLAGHIRLGMTEDTTTGGLSRILGRFSRLYPDVHVQTHVRQSLELEEELARGDIDLGVMQVFAHRKAPGDAVLFEDSLHWIKARDFQLDVSAPVPFIAFDENCFYRRWAMEDERGGDTVFKTVLECASTAGVLAGVKAGLGIALMNARHLSDDFDVIDTAIGEVPPPISYVIRHAPKSKSVAARALSTEIEREGNGSAALRAA